MSQCNEGTKELNRVIIILYTSIQVSVALFISIIGAIHVKRCKIEEEMKIQTRNAVILNIGLESLLESLS